MTVKKETYKIRNPYQRKMREDRYYNLRVDKVLKKETTEKDLDNILREGLEEYYDDDD